MQEIESGNLIEREFGDRLLFGTPGAETGAADDGDAAGASTGGADAQPAAGAASRRTAGSLRGAILDILQDHPGQQYKISELCKLIDAANDGTDAKKASAGAVHNAAMKPPPA